MNDTCENAIAQIRERDYLEKAAQYANEVLLVGISYDKTGKNIAVSSRKRTLSPMQRKYTTKAVHGHMSRESIPYSVCD